MLLGASVSLVHDFPAGAAPRLEEFRHPQPALECAEVNARDAGGVRVVLFHK
jgi:hypothetical protein